jgi:hypothetical protein
MPKVSLQHSKFWNFCASRASAAVERRVARLAFAVRRAAAAATAARPSGASLSSLELPLSSSASVPFLSEEESRPEPA